MLSSIVDTINNELSKKENKESIDLLYTTYVSPYMSKLYILVLLLVFLVFSSFFMNIYCSYNIYNNSHCLYRHASL